MTQQEILEVESSPNEIQFPEESVFHNILERVPTRLQCCFPLWPNLGQLHEYCKAPVGKTSRGVPKSYCFFHCSAAYTSPYRRAKAAAIITEEDEAEPLT